MYVMLVVYTYQWIEKKALEGRAKESPKIIVFRIAVSWIGQSKP